MRRRSTILMAACVATGIATTAVAASDAARPSAEDAALTETALASRASGGDVIGAVPKAPGPPLAVPTPPSSARPDAIRRGGDGVQLIRPFVAADALGRSQPGRGVQMGDVAAGRALEETRIALLELAEDQIAQAGTPTVVQATVTAVSTSGTRPTTSVQACLDYQPVDVRDRSGRSLVDTAAERRVASVFHLERVGGRWLVQDRTFPDDPSC